VFADSLLMHPVSQSPQNQQSRPKNQTSDCTTAASSVEVAAIILTLNESEHIVDCIKSLRWADRIVVFDSFSQDETVHLARQAGAEIGQSRFENYAQQRNAALSAIETDWVFFVDADERSTDQLAAEVRQVTRERSEAGWYVPRHNYIFGRLTQGGGWFPDYQMRLFQHGRVFYERPVHEIAEVDGQIGFLSHPLIHYNYRDRPHFHTVQRAYTSYDAGILHQEGVVPRPHTFITQPMRQFWWRFVTLRGHQDGLHGLRLSLYMAYYEWVKYRKLAKLIRAEN
jgi:(heptosyl)LPS beta-1,4-glucosyltransferase